jgi:dihydroorotate dehydrogenase electron transfer subunit
MTFHLWSLCGVKVMGEKTIMGQARLPQALQIVEIRVENGTTKTYILDGSLRADPGQFVMAWLPGHEDKPFSLADADPVSLTVATVGPFSRALSQLQVGNSIWVRGPLGRGFQLPAASSRHEPIVLVGGGYGVAPLLFLSRRALASGHRVTMIIGARSGPDLLLVEAFKALDIPLWLTTEDGSLGRQGLATDALSTVMATSPVKPQVVYACGPTGMLQAVAEQCAGENIAVQLAWESYMRCGLGLCGSCEVGEGWLTCLDGPVFPFSPLVVSHQDADTAF